jgi:hypothetical protein
VRWEYVIVAVILLFGIYAFLVLTGFETRTLSRRTTRTAESMYPSYADSLRKQRRYARQHGGEWTSYKGAPLASPTKAPTLASPKTRSNRRTASVPLAGPWQRSAAAGGDYRPIRMHIAAFGPDCA